MGKKCNVLSCLSGIICIPFVQIPHGGQRWGTRSPETRVTDGYELLLGLGIKSGSSGRSVSALNH